MPKMEKSGLVGGQEGEPDDFFAHPFFHGDVKATQMLGKNTYGLRLLPAFDLNIDTSSPDFKTSVVPYRNADKVDPKTGLSVFSPWYYVVKGYQFIGNEKAHFLSPLNHHGHEKPGIDPLNDMQRLAARSDNPDWVFLTKKPQTKAEGFEAPLPYPKQFVLANALVNNTKEGVLEPRAIVFGIAGLKHLKASLDMYRPSVEREIVDPNWPDMLLGDVTSPDYALWATVKKTVFNDAGMSASCFHFSDSDARLVNHSIYPLDLAAEWGQQALTGRYDFRDTENVTKCWTAEQILEYLVSDGFYPYDLIYQACSKHWEVPPESTHPVHSTPENEGGSLARPAAAPAPAPAPAAAPPRSAAPAAAPRSAAPAAAPRNAAPAAAPAATRPPASPAAGRPPVTPAAARPAAAPAARPAAPAAARPPVAPAAAARAPGAPAARPAAAKAPAQQQRPAAAAPRAAAAAQAAAAAPAEPAADEVPMTFPDEPKPWTEVDENRFAELEAKFMADGQLSPDEMPEYAELGDRRSAASQQ